MAVKKNRLGSHLTWQTFMEGKKSAAGPECANCTAEKGRTGIPYLKCSRCNLVTYCSSDCQKQHWTSGGHQKWCLTPSERSVKSVVTNTKCETAAAARITNLAGVSAECCPVCLEPLSSARITLPCSHGFHTSCLEGFRENAQQQTCPICRADLPLRSDLTCDYSAAAQCANNCGANKCSNGAPLVHCSKCKVTLYCGRDCQKAHWKNGGHRSACTQVAAAAVAADARNKVNKLLDSNGKTQLFEAAALNERARVKKLLKLGATVNQALATDGATPLFVAALNGYTEVVGLLMSGGAAVNQARTTDGSTPLYITAQNGHAEVVSLLINGGAAVNQATTNTGATPLFIAAQKGHAEVVGLLMNGGAAVNQATTYDGTTPLFLAAQNNHPKVVGLLMNGGAAVNQAKTTTGATPLLVAAQNGHAEVVGLLMIGGAAVNQARTTDGATPLSLAAGNGHTEVVGLLTN